MTNLLRTLKQKLKTKGKQLTENIKNQKKFHFIAIGGIGMSALAKYLLEVGCEVSGSDINKSKYSLELEQLGATVYVGHSAQNVPEDAVIVASSAIKPSNPEYKRALEFGKKIYHRSDILKIIAEGLGKTQKPMFIGFAGTHGKTTTSGLLSFVLEKAGYAPSFAVGGIIPALHTNAKCSKGDYFIAELDESDGTIVKYMPDVTVINNLEVDHLDFYKNGFETLLATFNKFISNLKDDAKLIVNADCSGCQKLMTVNPEFEFITFGLQNADYVAKNISYNELSSQFDVYNYDEKICTIKLNVLGKHNVYNALAVVAALNEAGVLIENIVPYFTDFSGMGRRFQFVGEVGKVKIFDDYAHHPSEIKATLQSVTSLNKNVVAIFQPHRYTRLKGLWNEFLAAFDCADELIVLDVFNAGDDFDECYNSEKFASTIQHKNCKYVAGTIAEAAEKIYPLMNENDVVITLGAGDVTELGKKLLELSESKVC